MAALGLRREKSLELVGDDEILQAGKRASRCKNHRREDSCLWPRDEQEATRQQEALQRGLEITELDPLEVEHRLAVGQHQSVQSQDLEHLESGHQRAATLLDDVTD